MNAVGGGTAARLKLSIVIVLSCENKYFFDVATVMRVIWQVDVILTITRGL